MFIKNEKFKRVGIFMLSSIVFASLVSLVIYTGFTYTNEMSVYADNSVDEEVSNIEVVEERIIPVYVDKIIEVEKEVEVEVVETPLTMRKVGDFYLTAYCPCKKCCEKWGGSPVGKTTALGVGAYSGITFAVDPSVIPYGTAIYVEGVGVGIATDCGGGIKKNRIDVYYTDHQEALKFGRGGGVGHAVYIIE